MLVVFYENFSEIGLSFVVGGSKLIFFVGQILNSRIVFFFGTEGVLVFLFVLDSDGGGLTSDRREPSPCIASRLRGNETRIDRERKMRSSHLLLPAVIDGQTGGPARARLGTD